MYSQLSFEARYSNTVLTAAARREWSLWIANIRDWTDFVSLTYDPGKRFDKELRSQMMQRPPPPDRVHWDLRTWLAQGQVELCAPYVAVAATETHKSGWPHVHALIYAPGAPRQAMHDWCQIWYARHGFARTDPVEYQRGVSAYVAKYMCKENLEITFYPFKGTLAAQPRLRNSS